MQQDATGREQVRQHIRMLRRAMWRETLLGIMGQLGELDLSFTQFGTLLYLEHEGEGSLTEVAAVLSRSLPATSRMVESLVQRGFVIRAEYQSDRRVKRIRLSDEGRQFIAALEHTRVEAQLAIMERLPASEYEDVVRAMGLLAHAATWRAHNEQNEQHE